MVFVLGLVYVEVVVDKMVVADKEAKMEWWYVVVLVVGEEANDKMDLAGECAPTFTEGLLMGHLVASVEVVAEAMT